jgi:acetyl esterase/lipase
VYRPKEREGEALPVIVSVHGGGWVYGDKEVYQYYCMSLAQRGFAVVNFTYRLAPEFKFPSSLEDTNTVFQWILDNSTQYGFDTEHIFAVGDSAGAQMLASYCAICTNDEYAANFPFNVPEGLKISAIALNCGAYEIKMDNPEDLTVQLMNDYLPNKGTKEEVRLINVLGHITPKFPPTFYMTCTGDMLIPQAGILGKTLVENNIPQEFHFYGNSECTLGHVFHCNVKLDAASQCNDDECDYFKKIMQRQA